MGRAFQWFSVVLFFLFPPDYTSWLTLLLYLPATTAPTIQQGLPEMQSSRSCLLSVTGTQCRYWHGERAPPPFGPAITRKLHLLPCCFSSLPEPKVNLVGGIIEIVLRLLRVRSYFRLNAFTIGETPRPIREVL